MHPSLYFFVAWLLYLIVTYAIDKHYAHLKREQDRAVVAPPADSVSLATKDLDEMKGHIVKAQSELAKLTKRGINPRYNDPANEARDFKQEVAACTSAVSLRHVASEARCGWKKYRDSIKVQDAKLLFAANQDTLNKLHDDLVKMGALMATLQVEQQFEELKTSVTAACIAMGTLKKEMAKSGSVSLEFRNLRL